MHTVITVMLKMNKDDIEINNILTNLDGWLRKMVNRCFPNFSHDMLDKDDLLQVARVEVWKHYYKWNPEDGKLETFLHKRVMGSFIDELRKCDHLTRTARRLIKEDPHHQSMLLGMRVALSEIPEENLYVSDDSLTDDVYLSQVMQVVEKHDKRGTPGIFTMHLLGFTARQIAKELNIKTGTVNYIIYVKRNAIVEELTEYD